MPEFGHKFEKSTAIKVTNIELKIIPPRCKMQLPFFRIVVAREIATVLNYREPCLGWGCGFYFFSFTKLSPFLVFTNLSYTYTEGGKKLGNGIYSKCVQCANKGRGWFCL